MFKTILFLLALTCAFISCNNADEPKEKMLVGKWKYSGMEGRDGAAVDLTDSVSKKANKNNEGVVLIFNADKTFESGREKSEGFESFGKETWRLSGDQNFIFTKGADSQEHKMQIIKLTPQKFVFSFDSTAKECLVFIKD